MIFFIILRVVANRINFHFICTQVPSFLVLTFPTRPPTTPQSNTRLISKAFSTQYKQTKNTPFSLPGSELNNICKCIYAYRKKLISEKNVNPVNEKIEEN